MVSTPLLFFRWLIPLPSGPVAGAPVGGGGAGSGVLGVARGGRGAGVGMAVVRGPGEPDRR